MTFDMASMWHEMGWIAKGVVICLLIMALMSIYVGIERWVSLKKARDASRELAGKLGECLGSANLEAALTATESEEYKLSYLGHIMGPGLKEVSERLDRFGIDASSRSMERASIQESRDLRRGMNILATVGSTAPFVGLVGTIFGIINAFQGMAETGSGELTAIAGGIAEALITTCVGIAVAILGVWLYNYFNARIDQITDEISISIQEFLDWCEKQAQARIDGNLPAA